MAVGFIKVVFIFAMASLYFPRVFGVNLADLSFANNGSRTYGEPTYTYKFSVTSQNSICDECASTNCWGVQGISRYNNYITRSLYQMGSTSSCSAAGATYTAISVMQKTTQWYSNILIELGEECHAGDHVLTSFNDTYYFLIACTDYVVIFSERDILALNNNSISNIKYSSSSPKKYIQKQLAANNNNKNGNLLSSVIMGTEKLSTTTAAPITVNSITFYYFVPKTAIIWRNNSDITFSYLSRNDGTTNEYFSGRYSSVASNTTELNLKKIKLDDKNNWALSILTSYTVKSGVAIKIQGATRIANYMILICSAYVRFCTMTDDVINNCNQLCTIDRQCTPKNTVFQGAETDNEGNGNLYIGTEFGTSCGKPFYEIENALNYDYKNNNGGNCIGS
jgi:hypothetical protein